MSRLLKQPLFWAWFLVLVFSVHSIVAVYFGNWVGLVITLTGLVAALLVVSAMQSRRRKTLYPIRHFADDTLPDDTLPHRGH